MAIASEAVSESRGAGAPSSRTPTAGTDPGTRPTVVGAERLAARFRRLAHDDLVGYCPTYERIAEALADDPASLELLLDAAPVGRTPVLSFAATHDLVLAEPDSELAAVYRGESAADPWPLYRALLHRRSAEILTRMRTRSIQTNEVGRSAGLVPALATVERAARRRDDHRPLALVEIGASAGLNLLLDRYSISYRRGDREVARSGDPDSTVQLACELRGPNDPTLPSGPLALASRVGLDLAPIDVGNEEASRWLQACVWPGVPDRPERLAAALALARTAPPRLVRGDATSDLGALLDAVPGDSIPVVVATWALAYMDADGREAVRSAVDRRGAHRPIALVTAEEAPVTPWLPTVPDHLAARGAAAGDGTATVLGLHSWAHGAVSDRVLALCHPHLRWMAWADPTEEHL